jgi:hypothetical protein
MGRRHLMDFDDFEGGSIGDALEEIVTPEQLKGLLLSGLVGGGGILGVGFLVRQLPVSVTPVWRSVIATVGGLIGGRLLWNLDEDAARGFAGGVSGFGIASLVQALAPSVSVGLSSYDAKYGWGMGQPGTRYMDWGVHGNGMGRTRVDPFPAGSPQLGRTRVEERQPNEFMLGRVGQDVSVGAWLS